MGVPVRLRLVEMKVLTLVQRRVLGAGEAEKLTVVLVPDAAAALPAAAAWPTVAD